MKKQNNKFSRIGINRTFRHLLVLFWLAGLISGFHGILLADEPVSTDEILFKIIKATYSNAERNDETLFIYKSGRVDCINSFQTVSKRRGLQKTVGCFQISEEQISKMMNIAEQNEFLNALDNYRFFNGGDFDGSSAIIIYYRDPSPKTIFLGTPNTTENNAPVPETIHIFLKEIQKIDRTMDLKYELDKRMATNSTVPPSLEN